MARIRSIKPEFPLDQRLGSISRDARLLYILLWPICDDLGLFRASPALLSSMLFPYDEDATAGTLETWLTDLIQARQVVLYQAEGEDFGVIPTLRKHQRPKSPHREPQHPVPPAGECPEVDLVIRKYASEQYRKQYFQGVLQLKGEVVPPPDPKRIELEEYMLPKPSEHVPATKETRSLVEEGRVEERRVEESKGEEGTGEESHVGSADAEPNHSTGEDQEQTEPPPAEVQSSDDVEEPEDPNLRQLAVAVLDGAKELGLPWRKPHRFLTARLREGATVAECIAVVRTMIEQWAGRIADDGRPMDQYLRQDTLFSGKFEGYLRQAQQEAAKKATTEAEEAARAQPAEIELPEPTFPELWKSVLDIIEQEINAHVFETYFKSLRGFYVWTGPFNLVAEDEFTADWVNDNYLDFIDEKIRSVYTEFGELRVIGAPEAASIVAAIG